MPIWRTAFCESSSSSKHCCTLQKHSPISHICQHKPTKIVCVTYLIKDHMFVKYKYIQNNKLRSFSSLPFARPARGPLVISSLPSSRRAVPITFSLTQGSITAFSELKGRRLTKQSWKQISCVFDHINMESNQQIISNGYHRTGKRVASAKQVVHIWFFWKYCFSNFFFHFFL